MPEKVVVEVAANLGNVGDDVNVLISSVNRELLILQAAQLFNGLSAAAPGSTYLLNISYTSPDPHTAQLVVNAGVTSSMRLSE